ncbi:hypothetical protein GCM10027514_08120 [Azotobacter armeniacus]
MAYCGSSNLQRIDIGQATQGTQHAAQLAHSDAQIMQRLVIAACSQPGAAGLQRDIQSHNMLDQLIDYHPYSPEQQAWPE